MRRELIKQLITSIGENPDRDGLLETPARVSRAWDEFFSGYNQNPVDVFKIFDPEEYGPGQLVLLKNVEFYSMCEHHMVPFHGKAHIAYVPDTKVIGVSKLARLLDIFAKRLQIQERIGQQVTSALMEHLQPKGAACILIAKHLCISSRGVQKQHSEMVTSSLTGCFDRESAARSELMQLIQM